MERIYKTQKKEVKIMSKTKETFHGSDLEKIEAVYGIHKEQIVSFAANVNPLGMSPNAREELKKHLDIISRYPDRAYTALRSAISSYVHAPAEHIILGNGVTELLTLCFHTLAFSNALIVGPTYSEYERDLLLAGTQISHFFAREEDDFVLSVEGLIEAGRKSDLVILCNPNNPTSQALKTEELAEILSAYQAGGTWLIIDETYVEFDEHCDEITASSLTTQFDHLIVLRGTSKFFATPGLRLGYALTGNRDFLQKVTAIQDPWSINSVAEFVGSVMFTDREYIDRVRSYMAQERDFLVKELSAIPGIRLYPPTANFILCRLSSDGPDAEDLFDSLIRKGMMIRNCSTFPSLSAQYIRICYMSHEDNVRLVTAIKEVIEKSLRPCR